MLFPLPLKKKKKNGYIGIKPTASPSQKGETFLREKRPLGQMSKL